MQPRRALPIFTETPASAPPPTAPNTARRRFCAKPFEYLEIATDGQAYLCCQSWMPTSIGYVQEQPLKDMWNGRAAREIRRSIRDGSFAYCTACPFLQTTTGSVHYVDEIREPAELALLESEELTVERMHWLNLAYDATCNLSCPSCRQELFISTGADYERGQRLQQRLLDQEVLSQLEWLYVTGSGDPFASRLFRTLLRSLVPSRYPRLKIKLHSNAQLFTPENWQKLGDARCIVRSVEVSIDAAQPDTYRLNRRGGTWEVLLQNLEFIASMRRSNSIDYLQISFVVQANNWREMPQFVALGHQFSVDCVLFTALRNWRTFSREEYSDRAVHLPEHPEYAEFKASLQAPELRRPGILLGDLAHCNTGTSQSIQVA